MCCRAAGSPPPPSVSSLLCCCRLAGSAEGLVVVLSREPAGPPSAAPPPSERLAWSVTFHQQKRFLAELMQLTLPACYSPNTSRRFALCASNVCAWSVKHRGAPSRRCRDARVYGHTTTAMHGNDYTLFPPEAEAHSASTKWLHLCLTLKPLP